MKACVSGIRPSHSEFGKYKRDEESQLEGDFLDIDEYASYVVSSNRLIISYSTDPDISEMGDEDGKKLAERLREVKRNVLGGHDKLVAYWLGNDEILIESVRLV